MTLIVQKFGGTSVGSLERIAHVAEKIMSTRAQGHQVVVVVSAMSGETDRLINLAMAITAEPNLREYDVLVSTGEQVSMSLLAMTLSKLGCAARSYTGHQAQIHTDAIHKKARIANIDVTAIREDLEKGIVPVIAGFQGIADNGDITTLGRGGSDTTAVALAASLGADECQIYTDVDGVYTADPRVVPEARRLPKVTFEEMLELASLGAKVLEMRSVEFAGKYQVPLRVLSSFVEGSGTLIVFEDHPMHAGMEQPLVSGIAFNRNEAKLTIIGIPEHAHIAADIVNAVSNANIDIDMIIQNIIVEGKTDFTFTVNRDDYQQALAIAQACANNLNAQGVSGNTKIAKLSLVGIGMRTHAGIASKMFKTLAHEGIKIHLISTSEIKISVVIDEKYLELGVRALHSAFELDVDPVQEFDPPLTR